jgi:uncharacterized protein (TIGR02145 family)
VPSDAEWNKLVKCIDPSADTVCNECTQSTTAGGAIKETGITHWLTPNFGATNISGFSALGSGWIGDNGIFYFTKQSTAWWTSTAYPISAAKARYLSFSSADLGRGSTHETAGFSVRLVKD